MQTGEQAAPALVPGSPEYTAAMVAKYEAHQGIAPQEQPATPPVTTPVTPPQDPPKDAPKDAPQDPPKDQPPAEAPKDAPAVDLQALGTEALKAGQFTPEALEALKGAGIDQAMAESWLAGQKAIVAIELQRVHSLVGGEENFKAMNAWAVKSLTPAEVEAYNRAVNAGDPGQAHFAVQGLFARFSAAGKEPRLVQGQGVVQDTPSGFASRAEMTAAMRDPRYDRDPAYRAQVAERLNASVGIW